MMEDKKLCPHCLSYETILVESFSSKLEKQWFCFRCSRGFFKYPKGFDAYLRNRENQVKREAKIIRKGKI